MTLVLEMGALCIRMFGGPEGPGVGGVIHYCLQDIPLRN